MKIMLGRKNNNPPIARKVANAPLGLSISMLLLWVGEVFGLDVPEEVAMSIVTIISYIIGHVTREAHDREPVEKENGNSIST